MRYSKLRRTYDDLFFAKGYEFMIDRGDFSFIYPIPAIKRPFSVEARLRRRYFRYNCRFLNAAVKYVLIPEGYFREE